MQASVLRPDRRFAMLPGWLTVAGIVALAAAASQLPGIARAGLNMLSLALFTGMLLGNLLQLPASTQPGITFAQQRLLRLGVMLFGLHVSVAQLVHVGSEALLIDLVVMATILIGGSWLGMRVFGLPADLAVMTAAGSAICGAAAVLATEPVVRGEAAHTSMAVASVVLFGTIAILLYPLIFHLAHVGSEAFGIYVGATVHEVAQVVAVGHSINEGVEQTAVIVKLMRVMLLAPVLLLLSLWWQRGKYSADGSRPRLIIPWFAFGFILVVGINSAWHMPPALHQWLETADTLMLAAAMAALGLGTRFAQMRRLGIRPLAFAGVLFVTLVSGGELLTRLMLHSHA